MSKAGYFGQAKITVKPHGLKDHFLSERPEK
jgi:hypothetical protein